MAFEVEVRKNAFVSTQFYIDEQVIRFDGKEIQIKDVDGFAYYAGQEQKAFINTGKIFVLFIYEKEVKTPHKLIGIYAFDGGSGNKSFGAIHQSLWEYIGNKQLTELHRSLLDGKEVVLQKYLRVNAQGAFLSKPGLFKMSAEVFNEWNDLQTTERSEINNVGLEDLDIKSKLTGKLVGRYHLGWINIRLFERYHQWLLQNPAELDALQRVVKE